MSERNKNVQPNSSANTFQNGSYYIPQVGSRRAKRSMENYRKRDLLDVGLVDVYYLEYLSEYLTHCLEGRTQKTRIQKQT
jgi:hypothetical protein